MNTLSIVAALLIGVIGANIIKQFVPRIPESFILIVVGAFLSLIPTFKNFELKPEFFMLVIIAPLMFMEGQKQSFNKIKKNFGRIILLSVGLSLVSALLVGAVATRVEEQWTLPLSIALAAIIIPTDAVAVKSITSGANLPKAVDDEIQLESLFNDAVGLVMLDLAISVMTKGSFSAESGIKHFLFVAVGGIIIGLIGGYIIVMLRFVLNTRATNPELITIPINLLTPFAIYIVAEHFGVSGILAVVATGIEHNWESNRLRLTSTNVQLTSRTIWNIVTDVLNDIVFLILGMVLPQVAREIMDIGTIGTLQLLGLSVLIYYVMVLVRYIWSLRTHRDLADRKRRGFFATIFSVSGIHGTVTMAMAFSLPKTLLGHPFPYREELIIVATFIIFISMITASVILPRVLPETQAEYTDQDLTHIRNKMVDHAILKIRDIVDDHDVREAVISQIQSQKNSMETMDREEFTNNSDLLLNETQELINSLMQDYNSSNKYSMQTLNIYDKIMRRSLQIRQHRGFFGMIRDQIHNLNHIRHHVEKEMQWHITHGVITKKQRRNYRINKLSQNPKYLANVKEWNSTRTELLELNDEIIVAVDEYLDDILQERLDKKHSNNDFIYMVRRIMDRFFNSVKHRYGRDAVIVDKDIYIQVFQQEYDYVRNGVVGGYITQSMASVLYTEINQAQLLQLYQEEVVE